jgi:hypothetical protein
MTNLKRPKVRPGWYFNNAGISGRRRRPTPLDSTAAWQQHYPQVRRAGANNRFTWKPASRWTMEASQNISDLTGWPGIFSGVSPYYDRTVARIARLAYPLCKQHDGSSPHEKGRLLRTGVRALRSPPREASPRHAIVNVLAYIPLCFHATGKSLRASAV